MLEGSRVPGRPCYPIAKGRALLRLDSRAFIGRRCAIRTFPHGDVGRFAIVVVAVVIVANEDVFARKLPMTKTVQTVNTSKKNMIDGRT